MRELCRRKLRPLSVSSHGFRDFREWKPCWQKPCWRICVCGLHGIVGASARVAPLRTYSCFSQWHFLVVLLVHLHRQTHAAHARKSANMDSANVVSVALAIAACVVATVAATAVRYLSESRSCLRVTLCVLTSRSMRFLMLTPCFNAMKPMPSSPTISRSKIQQFSERQFSRMTISLYSAMFTTLPCAAIALISYTIYLIWQLYNSNNMLTS